MTKRRYLCHAYGSPRPMGPNFPQPKVHIVDMRGGRVRGTLCGKAVHYDRHWTQRPTPHPQDVVTCKACLKAEAESAPDQGGNRG